jgi:hypothetical protein
MATNLHLDEKLLADAKRLGQHRTKREAANTALREYVQWHRQMGIVKLFGTVDFDPAYDYKKERKRR